MHALVCSLVALFAVANALVEFIHRNDMNWREHTISDYFTVKYGWIQSLGFVSLAVALVLLGSQVVGPFLNWSVSMYIGAGGLLAVILTKIIPAARVSLADSEMDHLHLISAGVAFSAITWAELHFVDVANSYIDFTRAAIATAVLYVLIKSQEQSIEEKIYTGLILAWFFFTWAAISA